MSLKTNQSTQQKDNGRVQNGNHPARIAWVIDLGEQHVTNWFPKAKASLPMYYVLDENGKTVKGDDGFAKKTTEKTDMPVYMPQVFIQFEFPTQRIDIGGGSRPRWQSKEYNVTGSGALAKLVESLVPGSDSIRDILGEACFVQVGSTSGGNAKIASVTPPVQGIEIAQLENPMKLFDMDAPDIEVFNSLPNFLQERIKSAKNYSGFADAAGETPVPPQGPSFDPLDDDIPF